MFDIATQPDPAGPSMLALTRLSTRLARPAALGALATRSYHENVVDHYENPRNVGQWRDFSAVCCDRGRCSACTCRPPSLTLRGGAGGQGRSPRTPRMLEQVLSARLRAATS
jgi:hypothetical protein